MIKTVINEIPLGSKVKYEINEQTGELYVDRIVDVSYPLNYGYVPCTLARDGDPLDVFLTIPDPITPGALIGARPIGVIHTLDGEFEDPKVIMNPTFMYGDVSPSIVDEIVTFLETYKKGVEVVSISLDPAEAKKVIEESERRYEDSLKKFGPKSEEFH